MENPPRESYKRKVERLEVALNGAKRRAEWEERDKKAAMFDVMQRDREIKRLRREIKRLKRQLPQQKTMLNGEA